MKKRIFSITLLLWSIASFGQAKKKLNPAEEQIFKAEAVKLIEQYYRELPRLVNRDLDSLVTYKIDEDDDEPEQMPYGQYFIEKYFENNDVYVHNDLSPDDKTDRVERRVMTIEDYLIEIKKLYGQGGAEKLFTALKSSKTVSTGYNAQAQEPFYYARIKITRQLKGSYLGKYFTDNTKELDFYIKSIDNEGQRLKRFMIISVAYESQQIRTDNLSVDEAIAKGLKHYNEEDYRKAFQYLLSKSQDRKFKKNKNATFALAYMYFWGRGTERDEKAMLEWLELAADKNNVYALFNLGENYFYGEYGDVEEDEKKGIKLIKKSARKGYAEAQYFMGQVYQEGKYIRQSTNAAKRWYKRAAKQGHHKAKYELKKMGG